MTEKDPFRESREKIRRQQEAREREEAAKASAEKSRAYKEEMDRRLAEARAKARAAQEAKEKEEAAKAAREEVTLPTEYTVQPGDSLSAIAQKFYGNAALWQEIYKANKKVIGDNPSLIKVGQVLKIPKLD